MIDGKNFDIQGIENRERIDREIVELVMLINKVDGIETVESCFGHNKSPCQIWCRAKDINSINAFVRDFFYHDSLWNICLTFSESDYFDELLFIIESKYTDYPTVNLMVENLTNRFKEITT